MAPPAPDGARVGSGRLGGGIERRPLGGRLEVEVRVPGAVHHQHAAGADAQDVGGLALHLAHQLLLPAPRAPCLDHHHRHGSRHSFTYLSAPPSSTWSTIAMIVAST